MKVVVSEAPIARFAKLPETPPALGDLLSGPGASLPGSEAATPVAGASHAVAGGGMASAGRAAMDDELLRNQQPLL